MSTGRTKAKWWRVYTDGYDLSGWGRSIGPLAQEYDEANLTAYMSDVVKGYLRNTPHVNVGTLNAVLDNTAVTGIHALMKTSGIARTVLVAIGIRAEPADGDPCFGGTFSHSGYQTTEDGGAVTLNIPFEGWAANASTLAYAMPWGTLLHAKLARTEATGVNVSNGFDNPAAAVTTTKGGYFLYQVFAGDGTATLSIDDGTSAIDADMDPLADATTGVINCAVPSAGVIAISPTATVRRYLRWQIDFNAGGGTATTVTFASAFMRNY